MSDAQHRQLFETLLHSLIYYADPGQYFAVSVLRRPKVSPELLGDLRFDYADEICGDASSVKPGQVARAAVARAFEALGLEPINWNEESLSTSDDFLDRLGIDLEDRRQPVEAEPEDESDDESDAEEDVPRHACCTISVSDAVMPDFELEPIPETDRRRYNDRVRGYMPFHCPLCGSNEQGGTDLPQPAVAIYDCGFRLRSCGHGVYSSEASRLRCEYGARLKAGRS
jgi:hypothetical protein